MTETRELEEICPKCGKATIEEKFDYNGKLYAVSVCTVCDFFNWIVPEGIDDTESKEFTDSEEWAERKADIIRMKHEIRIVPVQYSETVKGFQTFQIDSLLGAVCNQLGFKTVYVGKFGQGIRIEMR